MDWWRAKLLLIVAFICLDGFLGWQVAQLRVPRAISQLPHAVGAGYAGPGSARRLPQLAVMTLGWQEQTLKLLASPQCSVGASGRAVASSFSCSGSGGAALKWYNGVVAYSGPGPGPDVPQRQGEGLVAALLGRVQPDPLAADAGAVLVPGAPGQYQVFETYDGHPLFNGNWTVRVNAQITAQRSWVRVVQTLSAPERVISAARAEAELARMYGAGTTVAAGAQPLLGYYGPTEEPPGDLWYLAPVWRVTARIDCRQQEVTYAVIEEDVYIDAVTNDSPILTASSCPSPSPSEGS